jgi:hypothetical protein
MPTITMEVFKDEQLFETITLENRPFFIFGRHPACDVPLLHESISRFHTAFIFDKEKGALVVDLISKAKTKLDDKELEGCLTAKLTAKGSKVQFGLSTRTYMISVDYSRMQLAIEQQHRDLE